MNGYLVLTRKPGETIHIGDNITVTVLNSDRHSVRLGLRAPPEVKILRSELIGRDQ